MTHNTDPMHDKQNTSEPSKTGVSAVQCQHDYDNPKRLGRAHYHCPKCDADISLDLVFLADVEDASCSNFSNSST